MNNRRNYYRILKVQPDASSEIIKSNYRAIMQKLKMHPDLGGDEWNASIINMAYDVLKNPTKRKKYDESLLKQYCIKQLSRGHLHSENKKNNHSNNNNNSTNQRNYYRLLHVQTDSPLAIIQSSYEALLKQEKNNRTRKLIEEAFSVLSDEKKKTLYDSFLKDYEHAYAVELLIAKIRKNKQENTYKKTVKHPPNSNYDTKPKIIKTNNRSRLNSSLYGYQPVITQYCSFCKTPHNQTPSIDHAPYCIECNSPLFPPSEQFMNQDRRTFSRQQNQNMINVFYNWPGKQHRHQMLDISPTGIKIRSQYALENGQVLKIDADNFNAVGEVSYSQKNTTDYHYGIKFLTIMFQKQKGQFFSAKT